MPDEKPDLAFIELSHHTDSIHSHLLFLKDLFRIHLVINEWALPYIATSIPLASVRTLKVSGRSALAVAWETNKILRDLGPKLAFFHTAQGSILRALCFLLPRALPLMGLHHNPQKLIRYASFSQSLISRRLKHYFVLADYIRENIGPRLSPGIRVQDFYAVYAEKPAGFREIPRARALRVVVPGRVEQTRRDFFGLLSALEAKPLAEGVEIVVLGDGSKGQGPQLRERLRALGLDPHFHFFEGFVSEDDMASTLASCDAVLPLLHPGMPQFELFEKYKASGTFNLAYRYKKPLLLHQSLAGLKTYQGLCVGYEMGTLVDTLNDLAGDPARLKGIAAAVAVDPRFDPAAQRPVYEAFVREAMGG